MPFQITTNGQTYNTQNFCVGSSLPVNDSFTNASVGALATPDPNLCIVYNDENTYALVQSGSTPSVSLGTPSTLNGNTLSIIGKP